MTILNAELMEATKYFI